MNQKLYVGNLSFRASEEDLKGLFSEAGTVQSVKIPLDSYSGRSRGFGFVEMSSPSEAEKAISLFNGKTFMDRTLIVSQAHTQRRKEGGFRRRRDRGR